MSQTPSSEFEDPFETGKRDFEFCGALVNRIAGRLPANSPLTAFTHVEQVVLLVWHTTGLVDSGGFENLFAHELPGNPGHRLTPAAFEEIGCTECAEIVAQAIAEKAAAGREGIPLGDIKRLNAEFRQSSWSSGPRDPITQHLAAYIRAQEAALAHLK